MCTCTLHVIYMYMYYIHYMEGTVCCKRKSAVFSRFRRSDWTTMRSDGGWAWIVVIGATCVHCVCSGLHLAGGSMLLAVYQFIYDLEASRPPREYGTMKIRY